MKILTLVLIMVLTAAAGRATPVTIDEYLAQQDPPGVTVVTTEECECEDDKGVPLWPLAFLALVPIAFIDFDDDVPFQPRPPIVLVPEQPAPTPPTEQPTPTTVIPESSTLALALMGFAVWFAGFALRRKKILLTVLMMVTLAGVASAKPKTGTIRVKTFPAGMPVEITSGDKSTHWTLISSSQFDDVEFKPGVWHVAVTMPDGVVYRREIVIKARCVSTVDLRWAPPPEPKIVERVRIVEKPAPEPTPCPEIPEKPQRRLFDECCDCKNNDQKARLDLFAIELNRQPSNRAQVYGPVWAVDYLVNARKVDRAKVTRIESRCVSLWITP